MPVNKVQTSYWQCGVEDRNTYTQAQCRQNLPSEDEESPLGRIRYDPEANVQFWGSSYDGGALQWHKVGLFSLAGANSLVTVAAASIATLALSITF